MPKAINVMQVPKVEKVVINMGIGEAVNDRKKVENAANDLALIAGQRPVITRARKSIASFKVREGMALGAKVTLRGVRMYEFLDRLTTIALPDDWCNYREVIDTFKEKYGIEVNELDPLAGSAEGRDREAKPSDHVNPTHEKGVPLTRERSHRRRLEAGAGVRRCRRERWRSRRHRRTAGGVRRPPPTRRPG